MDFLHDVAFWNILIRVLEIYVWVIFAYVLMGYFVSYNNPLYKAVSFVVEPYINAFSFARIKGKQGAVLDFAPFVGCMAIYYILIPVIIQIAERFFL